RVPVRYGGLSVGMSADIPRTIHGSAAARVGDAGRRMAWFSGLFPAWRRTRGRRAGRPALLCPWIFRRNVRGHSAGLVADLRAATRLAQPVARAPSLVARERIGKQAEHLGHRVGLEPEC